MGEYLHEAFDRLSVELEAPTTPNELFVRYAIAAHTLYNFAKERNLTQPRLPWNDLSMCVTLIKQIRNLFAHSIIEPKWNITERYRLLYEFDDISISLIDKHGLDFDFGQVGGPETIFALRKALEDRI
ncbi:MAG: hypothetical protein ABJN69_01035 [Hellea sp.]